jgi:hypothetical protein
VSNHINPINLFVATALAAIALTPALTPGAASAQGALRLQASPAEVLRAFTEAINKPDAAAARSLVDPNGFFIDNPGSPIEAQSPLGAFVDENVGQVRVELHSVEQTGPDTVKSEYVLSGPAIPPLPSPVTASAVFTVENGRITRMVQTFSEQTMREFEVFAQSQGGGPAGMPSTGDAAGGFAWMWVAVALALAGTLGGLALQRLLPRPR